MGKRHRGGQPGNQNAKGHGAPIGNRNACGHGAPLGNRNAEKHGLFSTYLIPTEFDCLVAELLLACGVKLTLSNFYQMRDSITETLRTLRNVQKEGERNECKDHDIV